MKFTYLRFSAREALVRKGGFEPPRLSAPPPQDGVSASSTTSARARKTAVEATAIIAKAAESSRRREGNAVPAALFDGGPIFPDNQTSRTADAMRRQARP